MEKTTTQIKPSLNNYLERTKRNHFWVGGVTGQGAIKNLKIGVAGLGGMGSNIAEIFARLGVGYLRITDPDTIDRSNINRQVIAFEHTIGKKKATASFEELQKISADLRIDFSTEGITAENADEFVAGLDVVINEIDVAHIDRQLMLVEAAHRKQIPVYTTLVVGLGVHLYKFSPEEKNYLPKDFFGYLIENPCIERLIERIGQPVPQYFKAVESEFIDTVNSEGVPIFGASTFMGQALLAVRVLHDLNIIKTKSDVPATPHLPRFLVLDPLTLQFDIAELGKDGSIFIHAK